MENTLELALGGLGSRLRAIPEFDSVHTAEALPEGCSLERNGTNHHGGITGLGQGGGFQDVRKKIQAEIAYRRTQNKATMPE